MPKHKFFKRLTIPFDNSKADDAKKQAEAILNEARKTLAENKDLKMVGITYSANHVQTDEIRKKYSEGKWKTGTTGDNQAAVMTEVEKLLETEDYKDLQGKFRILPVTTMAEAGGVEKTNNTWLQEDLESINDFVNNGGFVLGWRNQNSGNKVVAIGGGVGTLDQQTNNNIQLYFKFLEKASNEQTNPPQIKFDDRGQIQLTMTIPRPEADRYTGLNTNELKDESTKLNNEIDALCKQAEEHINLLSDKDASPTQISAAFKESDKLIQRATKQLEQLKSINETAKQNADPTSPSLTSSDIQATKDAATKQIENLLDLRSPLAEAYAHAKKTTERADEAIKLIDKSNELLKKAKPDSTPEAIEKLSKEVTATAKNAQAEFTQAKEYLEVLETAKTKNPKLDTIYRMAERHLQATHQALTSKTTEVEKGLASLTTQPVESSAENTSENQNKPKKTQQEIIAIVKQVDERLPNYQTMVAYYQRQLPITAKSHDKADYHRIQNAIKSLADQLNTYHDYIGNDHFRNTSMFEGVANIFRSKETIEENRKNEIAEKQKQAREIITALENLSKVEQHEKIIYFSENSKKVEIKQVKTESGETRSQTLEEAIESTKYAILKKVLKDESSPSGYLQIGGSDKTPLKLDAHFGDTASVKHCKLDDIHAFSIISQRQDKSYVAELSFSKIVYNEQGQGSLQSVQPDESSQGHPHDPFVRIPNDALLKWAKDTVEDFRANAPDKNQTIQLRGNMTRQCAKAIMLYCKYQGYDYANKTKHTDLNLDDKKYSDKYRFYKDKADELFHPTLSGKKIDQLKAATQPPAPTQPKAKEEVKEEQTSAPKPGKR